MVRAKRWTITKPMKGHMAEEDFRFEEQELPALKDGEILCKALYLSVDPYIRVASAIHAPGDDLFAQQVARVTESKCPDYPVGSLVVGHFGWRTLTVVNARQAAADIRQCVGPALQPIPDALGDLSPSLALGVLGMPGAAAYFGTMEVLNLKPGETLFVNAAAGAVGSTVGQIGRIMGCNVIGCAGSDDKVTFLKSIGFDHAFNYKSRDLGEALHKAAPEGIDCFFENVGGHMGARILRDHMRVKGRVAICGAISAYYEEKPIEGPYPWVDILLKALRVEGFMGCTYYDHYPRAFRALATWIRGGQLQVKEHTTFGFDKMPRAFLELFTGTNVGKAIVKV